MRRTPEEIARLQQEALRRAKSSQSLINHALVIEAASARGWMDAIPGENVLTFNAWKALGRTVKKGEKAFVKLPVLFQKEDSDERVRTMASVFHISQTKELDQ